MSGEKYAVTESSFRAVSADMTPGSGETLVSVIPDSLLLRIRSDKMKAERSERLRDTDWTQMDDAPLAPAKKLEWGAYRQLLRDLPSVAGFPNVPWPQPPANIDGAADGVPGQSQPIAG